MKQQNIGGVQAHSVGPYYPIIVVGFGDGTWTASYGGVDSGRFKTARDAGWAAGVAHQLLMAHGPEIVKRWLELACVSIRLHRPSVGCKTPG